MKSGSSVARTPSFEERIAPLQRPGDGAYLLSHWDSYTTTRCRELCGVVSAIAELQGKPASGEKRTIRLVDYGCSSGTLFRALDYYLGHEIAFSFVGIDVDRRALGFVRAKLPDVELHEADGLRLSELLQETPITADVAVLFSVCYALSEKEVRRIIEGLSRIAPMVVIADQIDHLSGEAGTVLTLRDADDRPYDAMCHAFDRLLAQAGYTERVALPTSQPIKSITGYVVASKTVVPPRNLLEKHLSEAREDAFATAAATRRQPKSAPPPAPRANAVSFSIADVVKEIAARGMTTVSVYGDRPFFEEFSAALRDALGSVETTWFSGAFADVEQGAKSLHPEVLSSACVVIGGPFAHLYHPQLLRLMARARTVRPVFPVAQQWEFCLGQISFPAEVHDARAYLFNHFQEYFAIRDPILARLEAYDQRTAHERWILMQPGEAIELQLVELLPERHGPAVISVYTCAPVLTRGRHFRWRFCVDTEWNGSIATLHGAHDIPHGSAGTEFIQSRTSFGRGRIVFTLPNHYGDMADRGLTVECVDGPRRFTITRERSVRIDQVDLPLHQDQAPAFGDYIGCRFGQYSTPYWFSFEEADGRRHLSANHIQGQSFEFLTKASPTLPLSDLERSLLDHDIITWPYCVPVLPESSRLSLGLSFDSSWPVLRQFVLRFYDHEGRLLLRERWTKTRPGVTYTDELLDAQRTLPRPSIAMILVSPDWEGMNLDQQQNGISPIVDLVLRHRETGDYDITEFQNSWRNLGVVVEKMPHWIHFSNHLLGGTNLYGRALARDGWRAGALLINGSGNLNHDVEIEYAVRVFNREGRVIEARRSIRPFTYQLMWLDETFPDLRHHLGECGYGSMTIRSRDGDLNGQLVTVKDNRSVSVQHMWGY